MKCIMGGRELIRALLTLLLITSAVAATAGAVKETVRPNLVLIIADDLAWNDVGCYGHPTIRTPNLDRLAREGMKFTRGFVTAASCSPSRASMLTGRYPHSTDAEELHWPVPKEQVTFVEQLRTAGYWTAAAGKWHLGPAMKERFDLVKEADPSGFQLPTGANGKAASVIKAKGDQSGCADWVPTLQARPKDKPFFLWLAALDPHRDYEENISDQPYRPADVVVPPYLPDVAEVRKDFTQYYDEITRLDDFVGKVLKELDQQGVAENTLILFLSDNGRAFPRDKTTLYDGGIKTPWLIRWPKGVKAGSTCERLVSSVDIAPTLLSLAGVKIGETIQGTDFSALLNKPAGKHREFIYAEDNWHDYSDRARAVRSERFKYIRNDFPELPNTPPADGVRSLTYQAMQRLRDKGFLTADKLACFQPRAAEEFYDLANDPFELRNLASDPRYATELRQHRAALTTWVKDTNDTMPGKRSPDEFDRETGQPLPNRVRPRPGKEALK
ncbi:MAG: sgsA2 [Verrucomicrobia bacterium]|nr:sgsA2 [Verrucomicrobiota bacterium]